MKNFKLLTLFSILILGASLSISSCNKPDKCEDDNSCDTTNVITLVNTTPYKFNLKQPFKDIGASFDNTPTDNPTTVEGAELGRYLFYDKRLSANNTISCASCHHQKNAFSDPVAKSIGYEGEETSRNAMSVVNMRWQPKFFWDIRANTLEEQVLMPIQDHIEMGMTLEETVDKLKKIDIYPDMFMKAFGSEEIDADKISKALSQFVRTIISQDSKYDEALANGPKKVFTDEEFLGFELFFRHVDPDPTGKTNLPGSDTRGANCGDCHNSVLLTLNTITNNGLDEEYADNGYGDINTAEKWKATFKTPTLRNIELTAPYMHDGRFATLEEVIDHYDLHIKEHDNLDYQIKEAGNYFPRKLNLTNSEKQALIAFLKTLTDYKLISDPKYSDPFINP